MSRRNIELWAFPKNVDEEFWVLGEIQQFLDENHAGDVERQHGSRILITLPDRLREEMEFLLNNLDCEWEVACE